jgi:hypothetical protein
LARNIHCENPYNESEAGEGRHGSSAEMITLLDGSSTPGVGTSIGGWVGSIVVVVMGRNLKGDVGGVVVVVVVGISGRVLTRSRIARINGDKRARRARNSFGQIKRQRHNSRDRGKGVIAESCG